MAEITLRGVELTDGTRTNISIADGVIVAIGEQPTGAQFEASGLIAIPGLIDLHAHFREPGGEQSEDIQSGSRAAVSGGFTTVFAMPNTNPVIDSLELAARVESRGAEVGLVDVFAVGAVTKGLAGEELSSALTSAGSSLRVFSDDGNCISSAALMTAALKISAVSGCVISQHSQDPTLAASGQINAGPAAVRLGLAEWPNVAESSIVARDVQLAEATGGRLHVAHVSTAESVEVIRWAKGRGIGVTSEVTPHHLLLDDSKSYGFDTRFKVNPPLRSHHDREALLAGLLDGTIDAIATDHAPHARDAKEAEWQAAAFGMTGLQQALAVAQQVLVESAGSSWELVQRVLSFNPARIARLEDRGSLEVGKRADIVLVDSKRTKLVSHEGNLSRGMNNPYLGLTLPDPVVHVFRAGRQLVREGVVIG